MIGLRSDLDPVDNQIHREQDSTVLKTAFYNQLQDDEEYFPRFGHDRVLRIGIRSSGCSCCGCTSGGCCDPRRYPAAGSANITVAKRRSKLPCLLLRGVNVDDPFSEGTSSTAHRRRTGR